MDLEFKLENNNEKFRNDLIRESEMNGFFYELVDGERILSKRSENSKSFDLSSLTGRELLHGFVVMVNDDWYERNREFTFSLPEHRKFVIKPTPGLLCPGKGYICHLPQFRNIKLVDEAELAKYYRQFLSTPVGALVKTDEDSEKMWMLAVHLTFRIAMRMKSSSFASIDKIPVASTIYFALELEQLQSKTLNIALDGSDKSFQQDNTDILMKRYVEKKTTELFNNFFDNRLLEEEHEVDDVNEETAEKDIRAIFTEYFASTIQEKVYKLFLEYEDDNEIKRIEDELNQCLHRFVYCHHGQYMESGQLFELSGLSVSKAREDILERILNILIQDREGNAGGKEKQKTFDMNVMEEDENGSYDTESEPLIINKRKRRPIVVDSESDSEASQQKRTKSPNKVIIVSDDDSSITSLSDDLEDDIGTEPGTSTVANPPLSHDYVTSVLSELNQLKSKLKEQSAILKPDAMEPMLHNIDVLHRKIENLPGILMLPLKTKEDLETMESSLKKPEFADGVVEHLASTVRNSLYLDEVVRNILVKLMTNEFSMEFSWKEKRQKTGFADLELCKILLETVRQQEHHHKAKDDDIAEAASRWFRKSTTRQAIGESESHYRGAVSPPRVSAAAKLLCYSLRD